MSQRLGLTLPTLGFNLRASCDLARAAEDAGYTDIWTAEVSWTDGFASCAAFGVVTETIRLGVAIAPVFSRPPALLAMGALSAQDASDGRFVLGLGASTPTIVENWMGQEFDRPLTRMRETVSFLREAFSGGKVKGEATTFSVASFKLDAPPTKPVPIYLAALGPKMMELTRDAADGIALFAMTTEGVRLARDAVGDKEIVARLPWLPGVSRDEAIPFGKWLLAPYIAANGYNEWIGRQGYEDVAKAVRSAWASGERNDARAAVSDELVDSVILYGSAEETRDKIASFREAGLDTPIVMPLSQAGPDETRNAILELAQT